jgi:hypothetical protein
MEEKQRLEEIQESILVGFRARALVDVGNLHFRLVKLVEELGVIEQKCDVSEVTEELADSSAEEIRSPISLKEMTADRKAYSSPRKMGSSVVSGDRPDFSPILSRLEALERELCFLEERTSFPGRYSRSHK